MSILEWIAVVAVAWIALDVVLVLIWATMCKRGEQKRLAEGSLIYVAESQLEDQAIRKAIETLNP